MVLGFLLLFIEKKRGCERMAPKQKRKEMTIRELDKEKHQPLVKNWLTPEGLALLEGLSRDGYGYEDIANRIGVALSTIDRWRKKYVEIDEAFRRGRQISDYMVENALFKSALGYRTKEVSIKTKIEKGIVTEVTKDVSFKDQAPNMRAIEVWLYNRKPDLWKRDGGNRLDELLEDTSIQITVNKGIPKEEESWPKEVNDQITIDKPTNNVVEQTKAKDNSNVETKDNPKTKVKDNTGTVKINDQIEVSTNEPGKRSSGFERVNNERRIKNALPSDNIHVDKEEALDQAFNHINTIEHADGYTEQEWEEQKEANTHSEDLDEWPDDWEEQLDSNALEEGETSWGSI